MENSGKIILHHGSKSGINGPIAPISTDRCDFGKGFYMGTDRNQPLTLICNYPEAKLYTLSVDLSDLKTVDIDIGLDQALIHSLSALKLGKQYVALTQNACNQITILDEQSLSSQDRKKRKEKSEQNRSRGIALADEICRKYRREGLFFDEILKAGE